MDPLGIVLELYRRAQDVPVTQFHDMALETTQAALPFRASTWSTARLTPGGSGYFQALTVHLYREPPEMLSEFLAMNTTHSRLVSTAVRNAGRAVAFLSPEFMRRPEEAPMRAYIRRFAHERTLMIIDPGIRYFLSFYRPGTDEPFSARDCAVTTALLPHLIESLQMNQSRAVGTPTSAALAGSTALVSLEGTFLHCGPHFRKLLQRVWNDWSATRIPEDLLTRLLQGHVMHIPANNVTFSVRACGTALLVTASETCPLERLSPRERQIVRLFANGRSHKSIASDLRLAPATVRNILQNSYRKLGVHNKADLVRLIQRQERT